MKTTLRSLLLFARVLKDEVMLSAAFAKSEFDRYTFRSPGQPTSYFYGYSRLEALPI